MLTVTKRGNGFSLNGSGKELAKVLATAGKSYRDRADKVEDEEVKGFYLETADTYDELAQQAATGNLKK